MAVKAALRHVPNRAARTLLPNAHILSHYVTGKFFFWPICDAIIYNTEFLFTHFQMLLGTFPMPCWVCRTRNALKQKPACCGAGARWRRRAQSAAAAARGAPGGAGSLREPLWAPRGAGEPREPRRVLRGTGEPWGAPPGAGRCGGAQGSASRTSHYLLFFLGVLGAAQQCAQLSVRLCCVSVV